MSHLLDLDVAPLRVLGEQFPSKQFASFNEKAGGLYILALTGCAARSVWTHTVVAAAQVKYRTANHSVTQCVYYPIGGGGYI